MSKSLFVPHPKTHKDAVSFDLENQHHVIRKCNSQLKTTVPLTRERHDVCQKVIRPSFKVASGNQFHSGFYLRLSPFVSFSNIDSHRSEAWRSLFGSQMVLKLHAFFFWIAVAPMYSNLGDWTQPHPSRSFSFDKNFAPSAFFVGMTKFGSGNNGLDLEILNAKTLGAIVGEAMETPSISNQRPSELIQTITTILTSTKAPLTALAPYAAHLSPSLVSSILSSKALSSHPTILLSLFKWAQKHVPSFSSPPNNSLSSLFTILPSLFSHNKFSDAKSLLVSFIANDRQHELHNLILHPTRDLPRPSKALMDTSIGAYVQMGKPHLAAQIFKKMKRLNYRPNLLTCNTLLNSLVRYPSLNSILLSREVFKDTVKLGVVLNTNSFNILIYGYCLESKFKDALDLVNKMGEFGCVPDNVSYNTILDALCKKGQLHEARDLLLDMKNKGLLPNKNTYNILVSGYCKLGWLKEATKVIELMTQNNLLPDVWTYNMLISGFCNDGKIDEAFRLRDEMEKMKMLPDVVTYNTLIDGCFEWRGSSEAYCLIEEMDKKGLKCNAITYNIMLKWMCKEGNMNEATNTVQKMEENGFSPDCVTYNTLINAYCKAGKMGEAFEMMDEMTRRGLKIDTCTLNTILHSLCGEKKLDEAYKLLCSASKRGYIIDEVSYGTLIMGYFKDEKANRALSLWDEMKERQILPSIVTYNSVIGGLCMSGKTDQAIDKLNELLESGLVPDETTYNIIINGYCSEGNVEKAFQFHNKMVENFFKPDVFTCNILLCGLCREGMLEKALKLFNTWVSKGKDIDVVTYNTLISSLCKEGKFENAYDLLTDMEEKKLGPDNYTYNAILGALTDAGRINEAEKFMLKMVESGKLHDQNLKFDKGRSVATSELPEHIDSKSMAYSDQINELCNQHKYKDAMHLFDEVTKKGVSTQGCRSLSIFYAQKDLYS
ncbi:Pentatricopeptide repeat-containing protein, partial [Cucurbita argyrosperma subsp. sororia]